MSTKTKKCADNVKVKQKISLKISKKENTNTNSTTKKTTSNKSSKKAEKQLNTKVTNSDLKVSKEKNNKKTIKSPIKNKTKKNKINTLEIRKIDTHKNVGKTKKVRTLKDISKIISKNATISQTQSPTDTSDIKQIEKDVIKQVENTSQPIVENVTTNKNSFDEFVKIDKKESVSKEVEIAIPKIEINSDETKETISENKKEEIIENVSEKIIEATPEVKKEKIVENISEKIIEENKEPVSKNIEEVLENSSEETKDSKIILNDVIEQIQNNILESLLEQVKDHIPHRKLPEDSLTNKADKKDVISNTQKTITENNSEEIIENTNNDEESKKISSFNLNSIYDEKREFKPDTSINQNASFFYKPSVFKRYNINVIDIEDLEKDKADFETTDKDDKASDKNIETISQDAETLDKNVETSSQDTETLDKNVETSSQDTETLDKNVETINQETETIDKNVETSSQDTETLDKNVETSSQDTETLDKNVETTNQETETIDKNVETSSQDTETLDKNVETISQDTKSIDKDVNISNQDIEAETMSSEKKFEDNNTDLDIDLIENLDVKDIEELIGSQDTISEENNSNNDDIKNNISDIENDSLDVAANSNEFFDSSIPLIVKAESSKPYNITPKSSIFSNISSVFKKFSFEKNGIVSAKDMFSESINKIVNKVQGEINIKEKEELDDISSNSITPIVTTNAANENTIDNTFNQESTISIDMNSFDFDGIPNNLDITNDIDTISVSSDLVDNVITDVSELDPLNMNNEEFSDFTIDSTLDPAIVDDEADIIENNFVEAVTEDEFDDTEETKTNKKSSAKKDSSKKKVDIKEDKSKSDKKSKNNKADAEVKDKNNKENSETKKGKAKSSSSKSKKEKKDPEFEDDNMFKLENNPEEDMKYLELVYNNDDSENDDDFFSIEDYFGLSDLDTKPEKGGKKKKKTSRSDIIDSITSPKNEQAPSKSNDINTDELLKNVSKNISEKEASSLSQLLTSYTDQISTLSNKIAELESIQNNNTKNDEKTSSESDNIDLDNIDINDIDLNDIDLSDIDINTDNNKKDNKKKSSKSIKNILSKKFSKNNSDIDENMKQELLNEVRLSDTGTNNVSKEESPTDDFYTIIEALTKTISQLEGSGSNSSSQETVSMNQPIEAFTQYTDDDKAFNILIDKDDIFSISILNESYEIVADFDSISVLSQNIHIATPKKNFYVTVGEKYIEIHNTGTQFTVNTNFEDIEFANAINNVTFAKKENIIELNVKEAFKLSSVNNKIELSMLINTNVTEMKKSNVETSETINEASICDNRTLLISEETQKVYLPYTMEEIMQKLNNSDEYQSLEEVIENEYTVPLSTFKMPIISRFKEAYKFMREKEHSSVYAAVDLALELMFNSNLNPAVIRASKDLKELNVYLDCLYENEIEKFDCFKIVYKVLPKIK